MSQALNNLLTLLNLEKIEEGLFRGQSEDLGLRQVFGGQVVGQALYAAKETVPADRLVHSFHSYFLRPGDSAKPIVYDVEVLRDGNSFSARRVAAIQSGKPIFYMTASFQAPEPGYEHQKVMPPAPSPDSLKSETDIARALAQSPSEILLDEPTNHLDIHHQMQLMQLISELPVTSIVAIHDLNHAAMFCDSLIVMQQGQILASGTPEEILSEALLWDVFRVKTKIEISPYHGKKHIHFIV